MILDLSDEGMFLQNHNQHALIKLGRIMVSWVAANLATMKTSWDMLWKHFPSEEMCTYSLNKINHDHMI